MSEEHKNVDAVNDVNGEDRKDRCIFDSYEDAKENPPRDKPEWRIYRIVDPTGKEFFIYSGSSGPALCQVTGHVGWSIGLADSRRGVSIDPEAILARMDPEARALLLAKFAVPKKVKKTS